MNIEEENISNVDDHSPSTLGEADRDFLAPTFFAEANEVLDLISFISNFMPSSSAEVIVRLGQDPDGIASKVFMFEKLLNRYQDYPTIIVPHLTELMTPFVDILISFLVTPSTEELRKMFETDKQTEKHLLGADYSAYDSDAPRTAIHTVCRVLYVIVKTVGYKAALSYFPNDVRDLERVLYNLRRWQIVSALRREWEVRFCLFMWLSGLVLVPFNMTVIDSQIGIRRTLADALLDCAWDGIKDPSRCNDVAIVFVARLMTRPDAHKFREDFMLKAKIEIGCASPALKGTVLLAVAAMYKLGKREEMLPFSEDLIPLVGDIAISSTESKTTKAAVKVEQRLGLSLLPKRNASWRYKHTIENLGDTSDNNNCTKRVNDESEAERDQNSEEFPVPVVIQNVIGDLLSALSNPDTIVRWSAAKGIARITERLPKNMGTDVVLAVFEVFDSYDDASGWHGGCLALAELCRRGILLPEMFEKAMQIIGRGLSYELPKGSYSVGSNVRDASCYVCWAFSRAYNSVDIGQVVQLSVSLVTAALFDREVSVRRAAAAALQECVGRTDSFPHGIELITTMDFFSLASIGNSYCVVAPKVAELEEYTLPLVRCLISSKLRHWDRNVRALAAECLARITLFNADIQSSVVEDLIRASQNITDVAVTHGAVLALAEILIRTPPAHLSPELFKCVVGVVPYLDSRRAFRGRGGEYVREAACHLVAGISTAGLTLPDKVEVVKVTMQAATQGTRSAIHRFLKDSCKQVVARVQQRAVDAFYAFAKRYYIHYVEAFHGKELLDNFLSLSASRPLCEVRGAILALGAWPLPILSARLPENFLKEGEIEGFPTVSCLVWEAILDVFTFSIKESKSKTAHDPESRRNVVVALGMLTETLAGEITETGMKKTADIILNHSLCDYAIDNRGDVGALSRLAALRVLPRMLSLFIDTHPNSEKTLGPLLLRFVQLALKVSMEKLDNIRTSACQALIDVITFKGVIDSRVRVMLLQVVSAEELKLLEAALCEKRDWGSASAVFSAVLRTLARTDAFGSSILEGACAAMGGFVPHTLRAVQECFFEIFAAERDCTDSILAKRLLAVASACEGDTRVALQVSSTLERLLRAGVLHKDYHVQIVQFATREVRRGHRDLVRLLKLLPLVNALCCTEQDLARRNAWKLALSMLNSPYPKLCSRAAEGLYSAFQILSATSLSNEKTFGAAMDILLNNAWDNNKTDLLKMVTRELYESLGIEYFDKELLIDWCEGINSTNQNKDIEDIATYKTLVEEAGY